jgi:hypothetical protein
MATTAFMKTSIYLVTYVMQDGDREHLYYELITKKNQSDIKMITNFFGWDEDDLYPSEADGWYCVTFNNYEISVGEVQKISNDTAKTLQSLGIAY